MKLAIKHIIYCHLIQIEYKKQKQETVDNYRGFQTMDSKDHPVVQQGIKAAELTSNVSIFVLRPTMKHDLAYDIYLLLDSIQRRLGI